MNLRSYVAVIHTPSLKITPEEAFSKFHHQSSVTVNLMIGAEKLYLWFLYEFGPSISITCLKMISSCTFWLYLIAAWNVPNYKSETAHHERLRVSSPTVRPQLPCLLSVQPPHTLLYFISNMHTHWAAWRVLWFELWPSVLS